MTSTRELVKRAGVALLVSLAFAVTLATLIARYWASRDLGTSGANGMALVLFVVPIATLTFWAVVLLASYLLQRAGVGQQARWLIIVALLAILVGCGFGIEVWRTSKVPSRSEAILDARQGVLVMSGNCPSVNTGFANSLT